MMSLTFSSTLTHRPQNESRPGVFPSPRICSQISGQSRFMSGRTDRPFSAAATKVFAAFSRRRPSDMVTAREVHRLAAVEEPPSGVTLLRESLEVARRCQHGDEAAHRRRDQGEGEYHECPLAAVQGSA